MVALGIGAGCGGEGEDSTSSAPAKAEQAQAPGGAESEKPRKTQSQRPAHVAATPEEEEAERTVADFYAILGSGNEPAEESETAIDAASFCDLMSKAAVEQTVRYAQVSSGIAQKWDCESAVNLLVGRAKRSGAFEGAGRVEVVGVNAEGGRATATIQIGKGPVTSIPLVKEDGQWKLAANALGE